MKKTIPILVLGVIVMLAACKKSSTENTNGPLFNSTTALRLNTTSADPAANPENPYDSVGFYHNLILDSLRHYVKTSGDTTRKGKAAYLDRYFKVHFGVSFEPFIAPQEKLACTDYKAILLTQQVSASSKELLQALSDALQNIRDLEHYETFKQQVMAIERKIMDSQLPADENRNLLLTASILRHSAYYWMNAFKSGDVIQHNTRPLASTEGLIRKIIGVITGIGADASVVAGAYLYGDYGLVGRAVTWSEICGYYTGWW